MGQDIDVTDVESYTKIRAKFLRSLENEEWALVGDDTLVRSFLRTYAEYLGLDPQPLVEEFILRREMDDHSPASFTPSRHGSAPRSQQIARIALGLSLAVLAGLILWLGGSN